MYVLCVTKDVMSRSSQLFDSICFWSCVALVVLLGINIKHHAPLFGLSPVLLLKSHCKPLASSKNSHLVIHKKKSCCTSGIEKKRENVFGVSDFLKNDVLQSQSLEQKFFMCLLPIMS
jgi:hypothetical protein